ncbi:Protein of unknown function [Ectopseudomonas chengduensis]|uniref:Uncharacterized protein n=1 Tax=Ectopseudomonas chengduensis TaxID=489632 RepID=A0A1G6P3N9_9GAMM|nr:DUF2514 family protein [Pseudomonas chengduensis]MBP3063642.1 DUF2514 family protein [Pseudomonas chengduensis]NNB73479.1 DUF2514 family protein [Pseudomonas chengduensis]SDC74035.1 Protein of unknown function [Pseudomonas chengduensis]
MIAALADRATVLGIVAGLAFLAGWKVNGWRLGEGIAQGQVEAVTIVRVIERQQQSVADAEGQKGHDQLEELQRRAADAGAAADGLRKQASSLATQLATCNAGTAGERTARERAASVLADVLGEMESEGRWLAAEADGRRIKGLTCERTYEGVKAAPLNLQSP